MNRVKFFIATAFAVSMLCQINAQSSATTDEMIKREAQDVVQAFLQGWDAVQPFVITNNECQQLKATQLMYFFPRIQREAMETQEMPKDIQFEDFIFNQVSIKGVHHLIGFATVSTEEGVSMLHIYRHNIGRPFLFAKVGDKWKLYWVTKHWYFVTFDENNTAFATDGGGTYKLSDLLIDQENNVRKELK